MIVDRWVFSRRAMTWTYVEVERPPDSFYYVEGFKLHER
jgi:hypothetical protein